MRHKIKRQIFKFAFTSIVVCQNSNISNKNHGKERTCRQGWKPGYLALGYQLQFWCVETQMSGFSFGLVSQLLKNRF